jgi:GH15 family glucan-1,4-alpha-glucosidase
MDMHSVALMGTVGSIDWLCFPHFDSPSVFAAILDEEKGGRFKISPFPDGVTLKTSATKYVAIQLPRRPGRPRRCSPAREVLVLLGL